MIDTLFRRAVIFCVFLLPFLVIGTAVKAYQQITSSGASSVTSVFTRTGVVTATSGDYTAAQVTNAADKSSGSAQVFSGTLQTPDGTLSLPALSFTNETNSGWFRNASQDYIFGINALSQFRLTATASIFRNGNPITWASSGISSPDAGLSRDAPDVVDCGNGTQGDKSCTFNAAKINQNGNQVPSIVCSNVTPVTVNANTVSDQNLMTCTVAAGSLNSAGRAVQIQSAGVYSTPAASTSTITLKVKLCTVSGCGSGTVLTLFNQTSTALGAIQATNNPFSLNVMSTTQTAGASAVFEAHGTMTVDVSALAAAAEAVFADNNTATIGTIDSTAQLFLQITIAFSSASGSNSATQRQGTYWTLN
jgi:hypothetical protein